MRPYYEQKDQGGRYSYGPQFRIGGPLTPAVKWIIILNIAVYLVEYAMGGPRSRAGDALIQIFGFVPAYAIGRLWVWQFVTYMFLHAGFTHIFFNLFFFWMLGGLAEERLGTRRFVWLYILSGVGGALAQAAVAYGQAAFAPAGVPTSAYAFVPTVGASGAIMGVATAVALLYPDMILLIFFILPMRMKYFIWVLVLFQVYGLTAAAGSTARGQNVAYFAHLAGMGVGYLFIRWHNPAGWWLAQRWHRWRTRVRKATSVRGVTHIGDEERYREEVDRLLDKIFREGTQSLSREENEFLRQQSKRYKR